MPNADNSGINCCYTPPKTSKNLSVNNDGNVREVDLASINPIQFSYSPSLDEDSPNFMFANEPSTNSSDSTDRKLFQSGTDLSLDEDGKIKPYVDFSSIYIAIEEAKKDGLIIEDD